METETTIVKDSTETSTDHTFKTKLNEGERKRYSTREKKTTDTVKREISRERENPRFGFSFRSKF